MGGDFRLGSEIVKEPAMELSSLLVLEQCEATHL